jgi:hypothetical protein
MTEPSSFRLDHVETAQVGGDQEMKVLKEMNKLPEAEKDNWSNGRWQSGIALLS